jgi:hypothetical protein
MAAAACVIEMRITLSRPRTKCEAATGDDERFAARADLIRMPAKCPSQIRGQDPRQTPVAAEKQRRATHLRAFPFAGDWLDRMRLFSERRFTAVAISDDPPIESMKWKIKFAAATSRHICPHDRKGNRTVLVA